MKNEKNFDLYEAYKKRMEECDIIDIANEEMKKIDSTKIDNEFKKVFKKQSTQNLIELIATGTCKQKDLEAYMETIGGNEILDLRVSEYTLYVKTEKDIIPLMLSQIMGLDEKYIEKVPINGRYEFFAIRTKDFLSEAKPFEQKYDPDNLVDLLLDIGGDCIEEDVFTKSNINKLIWIGLEENWETMPDEIYMEIDVEDKVVAIALNAYIENAKKEIGEALFLNPDLFIEVSGPTSTVLLIDTRRWYLEPNFGGSKWYL